MRAPPLFETSGVYARELTSVEVPLVQGLFDLNPEYFQSVNGRCARPDEAQIEFDELPPSHLRFSNRWFAGIFDRADQLVGVVVVVSDLGAFGIWHIALLLLASSHHGRGIGSAVYRALEAWAHGSGAHWMRLGVVQGNQKAERFWLRQGFVQVRSIPGVDTGGRLNDVLILVKSLSGSRLAEYLARVPRDDPETMIR